jgi:hypothetical protein
MRHARCPGRHSDAQSRQYSTESDSVRLVAGIEAAQTDFVVHLDGDMLLHQTPGRMDTHRHVPDTGRPFDKVRLSSYGPSIVRSKIARSGRRPEAGQPRELSIQNILESEVSFDKQRFEKLLRIRYDTYPSNGVCSCRMGSEMCATAVRTIGNNP